MADIELLLEAERRGILPSDKAELLTEARKRGLIPQSASSQTESAEPQGIFSRAIKNVPSSAMNFATNLISGLEPQNVAHGIQALATDPRARQAVVDMYKNRFMHPAETFATDPVGFGADVALPLSLTGRGVSLVGKVGEMGNVARVGEAISTAANTIDPLNVATQIVGRPLAKLGQKVVTPAIGAMTGYSAEAIRTAFSGGKVFRDWMRGDQGAEDILNATRGAVDDIADARKASYEGTLQTISQNTGNVDITPIRQKFQEQLTKFGIKETASGELDFSRARGLDKAYQKDITDIKNKIDKWGAQAGDYTPFGMDTLKQQLDNYFTEIQGGKARIDAFLAPVKNQIIKSTATIAPEYPSMLTEYGRSKGLQDTIQRAFTLKDKASADTAVTKITQALKDNKEFRAKLIDTMDSQTGSDLRQMIAGYQLRGYTPQTWLGRSVDVGTMLTVGAGAINPKFLAVLGLSSPRVMGEFSNVLGRAYTIGSKNKGLLLNLGEGAFQTGRATTMANQAIPQTEGESVPINIP